MLRQQTVNVRVGQVLIALHIHVTLEATQLGKRYFIIKSTSSPNNLYITSKDCKSGCYAYSFPHAKDKRIFLAHTELRYQKSGDLHALIQSDHDP